MGINYDDGGTASSATGATDAKPITSSLSDTIRSTSYPKPPTVMTDDERLLQDAAEAVAHLSELMERKRTDCYWCKGQIERLVQVGRCVYARPCGCRIYQGRVPELWMESSARNPDGTPYREGESGTADEDLSTS